MKKARLPFGNEAANESILLFNTILRFASQSDVSILEKTRHFKPEPSFTVYSTKMPNRPLKQQASGRAKAKAGIIIVVILSLGFIALLFEMMQLQFL
jgi:hypothetical protein